MNNNWFQNQLNFSNFNQTNWNLEFFLQSIWIRFLAGPLLDRRLDCIFFASASDVRSERFRCIYHSIHSGGVRQFGFSSFRQKHCRAVDPHGGWLRSCTGRKGRFSRWALSLQRHSGRFNVHIHKLDWIRWEFFLVKVHSSDSFDFILLFN